MEADETIYCFDDFRVMARRQILFRSGSPVHVGSRAAAILTTLLERSGELVSKEELISKVWPNVFVHEAGVKVAMSGLRRALGENASRPIYIETVPGRGYRFIAAVTKRSGTNPEATSPEISPDVAQLPEERRIIGREVEVARTAALVAERPLVTLVGPGGVGKTSVAIVAAHRLLDIFPDKPCFIDLSLVQDSHHVPTLVASALGMRGSPLDTSLAIAEFIGARRMLVIFDSCEHVLPGVQALTSRILERNTTSRLILTSREPLGGREETLVHVRSLPVPDVFRDRAADDLLRYPAVELFLTRAQEWTDFEFRSSMAGAVASICRSLDGLPLALEIGAAQLDCHEPAELLAKLTKHLADFGNKNDSAPSRQKTLWATLDWSYKLLSADEAVIFRFLSVFAGSFDLEDVLAVLGPLRLDAYRIAVGLGALVAKSLVVADADGTGLRYRLLDSARGYALERAGEDPRLISVQESYAHYLVDLFKKAEAEWLWRETTDWRSHYKSRLNDLRQVLDWCFGPGSQPHLGFELTVCALPLWDELSSTAEAQSRIEQSLKHADRVDVSVSSLAKLTRAHAWHLLYADQVVSESTEAWETAIGYAQQTGEVEYELRALWGFGCFLCHNVNVEQAFGIFERFRDLSIRNKAWTAMPDGEWHHALVEIYLGRLVSARGRLEKLARDNPLVEPRTCAARFVVDRHIAIQTHFSFLLWLIGEPERALRLADEVSGLPDQIHNPVSRVGLLAWCRLPIAMWNGDWPALSGFASEFRTQLEIECIPVWLPTQRFYHSLAEYQKGDAEAIRSMSDALSELVKSNHIVRMPLYLGVLTQALVEQGDIAGARTRLSEAFSFAERRAETWTNPELLRIAASLSRAEGDTGGAQQNLREAIRTALGSGALCFALKAANDLAEIHLTAGRRQSARDVLQPIYGRFSEGFYTHDLAKASRLLEEAGPLS